MEIAPSSPAGTPATAPAQLAKGALRRLALAKQEPTPANYARAYADEAGEPAPGEGAPPARARPVLERLVARVVDDAGLRHELLVALMAGRWDEVQRSLDKAKAQSTQSAQAWAGLIERLARGLERGGRHWTHGRKKESLQRVLDGSRSDGARLQQRLGQLLGAWDSDTPDHEAEGLLAEQPDAHPRPGPAGDSGSSVDRGSASLTTPALETGRVLRRLSGTVQAALPVDEPRAVELAQTLAGLAERLATEGSTPALADELTDTCARVDRLLGLRHQLVDELLALCRSLTDGLVDMAEDPSWAQGPGQGLRQRLDGAASARAVRAARALLDQTREQQRSLHSEREMARDAFKQVFAQMLSELVTLDQATGQFSDKVAGYALAINSADSLPSLAQVVRELLGDSQAVHEVVAGARERLAADHARAVELETKVRALEAELRRLADEVGTDALTQVANRRGLDKVFAREQARLSQSQSQAPADTAPLAVGLLDIDNFKKLNDSLGHAVGDVALRSLADKVKQWLRPVDHVARFGGEEFVVLLPRTPVAEAQQILTRLQRQLTASLFMHEGKEVFVTFSAGVTAYRPGEALEPALARADEGLYEAKRTGKNRTCIV